MCFITSFEGTKYTIVHRPFVELAVLLPTDAETRTETSYENATPSVKFHCYQDHPEHSRTTKASIILNLDSIERSLHHSAVSFFEELRKQSDTMAEEGKSPPTLKEQLARTNHFVGTHYMLACDLLAASRPYVPNTRGFQTSIANFHPPSCTVTIKDSQTVQTVLSSWAPPSAQGNLSVELADIGVNFQEHHDEKGSLYNFTAALNRTND